MSLNFAVDTSIHTGLIGTYIKDKILQKLENVDVQFPYNTKIQFNTTIDANELIDKIISTYQSTDDKKVMCYSLIGTKMALFYDDTAQEYTQVTIDTSNKDGYFTNAFYIMSNKKRVMAELDTLITNECKEFTLQYSTFNVRWYFKGSQSIEFAWFEEPVIDKINPLAYPSIPDLDKFVDNYINSKESVLVLKGEPGVGKTTLIRYIISKCNRDEPKECIIETPFGYESVEDGVEVFYTADTDVLESDEMFINFAMTSNAVMVLEDIDLHLTSRSDGNVFMYKLLSASDGLVKNVNRKIIISTNLSSNAEIDDALIRKGRCYAVVDVKPLDTQQAKDFLKEHDTAKYNLIDKNKKPQAHYTLAELYADTFKG